jgi:hypothetical protein
MRAETRECGNHTQTMNLNSEKLAIYFGTLNKPGTLSQVAEELYGEKKDSARTAFSRKKALEEMLEENLLEARKNGRWKYSANKDVLEEIICGLLEYENTEEDHEESFSVDKINTETLGEMFRDEQVFQFFKNQKLSKILGETVSETKKQLSMYIKLLYITLAGARIVVEDIDLSKGKSVSLKKEGIEKLQNMIELINFASKESPLRIGPIFEEIVKEAPKIDIMQLPRTDDTKVNQYANKAKMMIEQLTGSDIESLIEIHEGQTAVA